ncbi:hypothetical protein ACFVH9_08030 [Streptomyces hirsutus]|uniref:hypothetical protein n=1 Tax=Streptomyces hirsutus TaxID=35620 RepID=UPI0036371A94
MKKPQGQIAEPSKALHCHALAKSGDYSDDVTARKPVVHEGTLVLAGGTLVVHEGTLVMAGGTLVTHEGMPVMHIGTQSKTTTATQIVYLITAIMTALAAVIGVVTMLA